MEKFTQRALLAGALIAGGGGFLATAEKTHAGTIEGATSIEDEYSADTYAFGYNTLYNIVGHQDYDGQKYALIEFHGGGKMRSPIASLVDKEVGTQFILIKKEGGGDFDEAVAWVDMTDVPKRPDLD